MNYQEIAKDNIILIESSSTAGSFESSRPETLVNNTEKVIGDADLDQAIDGFLRNCFFKRSE